MIFQKKPGRWISTILPVAVIALIATWVITGDLPFLLAGILGIPACVILLIITKIQHLQEEQNKRS